MPIDITQILQGKSIEDILGMLDGILTPDSKEQIQEWVRGELDALVDKVTGRRDDLITQLYAQIEDLKKENAQLRDQLNYEPEPTVPDDDDDEPPVNPPLSDAEYPAPMYSPGKVVIPAEFLKHGAFRELRFEKCSLANGLLKKVDDVTFTLPGPEHDVWRWTDQQPGRGDGMIGTVAKFADGSQYDGWVRDYHKSYTMPIGKSSGAFWVRTK